MVKARRSGGAGDSDSLSNRRESPPKNGDFLVGVDRLSLSFPIEGFDPGSPDWTHTSQRPGAQSWGRQVPVAPGVGVFVGVQRIMTNSGVIERGKVEWNPSRVMDEDPGGFALATVADLKGQLPAVQAAVESSCSPAQHTDVLGRMRPDSIESWKVKRLDAARHFGGVDQPGSLLKALAPIPRSYARLNLVHADPSRNGAETLMVGSRSGVARLYQKGAENDRAPSDLLRWEVEARGDWTDRYGNMRTLRAVTSENVAELALNRWEWSQMGAEVAGDLSRLVEAVRASDLSPAERRSFLGYLVEQAAGMPSELSNDTQAKYRRLQRQLGISAPADLGATVRVLRRLDWDSGTVVERVA